MVIIVAAGADHDFQRGLHGVSGCARGGERFEVVGRHHRRSDCQEMRRRLVGVVGGSIGTSTPKSDTSRPATRRRWPTSPPAARRGTAPPGPPPAPPRHRDGPRRPSRGPIRPMMRMAIPVHAAVDRQPRPLSTTSPIATIAKPSARQDRSTSSFCTTPSPASSTATSAAARIAGRVHTFGPARPP